MKFLKIGWLFLLCGSVHALTCRPVNKTIQKPGELAVRQDCETANGKVVHVLKLKGTYAQMAYNQGYLLAQESRRGLLAIVPDFIEHELGKGTTAMALYNCLSHRVRRSAAQELLQGDDELIRGVRDGLGFHTFEQAQLNPEVLANAALAVDTGIALEGLKKRLDEAGPIEKAGLLADVGACLLENKVRVSNEEILDLFKKLGPGLGHLSGCTGFVVPSAFSENHSLIHARNLDGDMMEAFAAEPTLFLIAEKGRIPSGPERGKPYHRFVSVATAGMPYPGGISGFNDAGLSASIHEMQTTHYRTVLKPGTAAIGPYLQHRILREAANIDEAFEIVKNSGRVGAWSIFVSDAKTNEAATIEFTADKVQLAYRVNTKGKALRSRAQTNHFFAPDMQDQYYNYNFNKYKESRARLATVDRALKGYDATHSMTLQDAIDLLADHHDSDIAGSPLRSFGRTVVKAYTSLSTVAFPGIRQMWFSSGDRYPIPQGVFVGFQADFANFDVKPLEETKTHQYVGLPNWDLSLSFYTRALIAYEHDNVDQGIHLIEMAIEEAQKDHQDVTAYRFVLARLLNLTAQREPKRYAAAMKVWRELLAVPSVDTDRDGYDHALIAMYSVVTSDALLEAKVDLGATSVLSTKERRDLLSQAERVLGANFKKTSHFDLKPKLELVHRLQSGRRAGDLPDIDMAVIFN